MKTSLQYTQKDVEELKPIHAKLEDVNKELDKISKDLASHSQKMEYLENQSRRNNIRVNGIPESDNETWEDAEAKVKRAIKENLDVTLMLTSKGLTGWKGGKPSWGKPTESAENHRVQIKRLETEGAGFAQS